MPHNKIAVPKVPFHKCTCLGFLAEHKLDQTLPIMCPGLMHIGQLLLYATSNCSSSNLIVPQI